VGGRAGTVHRAFADRAAQSHHFVKDLSSERDVAEVFERIDWRGVKARTAGNPSIGKREMVEAYAKTRRRAGATSRRGEMDPDAPAT